MKNCALVQRTSSQYTCRCAPAAARATVRHEPNAIDCGPGQDLKNEISAREQEKNALRDQMGELQAKADQRTILQAQVDSFASDKSRLEEEMMSLKSELAEVTMQAAQLRGEAARHDITRSVHATEMERLRMALEAAGNNNVRQAEKWKQKATGLTKEHVHAMDTRSKVVADEVAKLTEQWQKDVAARDLRMQEMQSTASDLQKKVWHSSVAWRRILCICKFAWTTFQFANCVRRCACWGWLQAAV